MLNKDDKTGEMNEMGKIKNKGILEMKKVHEEFTRKIARSKEKNPLNLKILLLKLLKMEHDARGKAHLVK